MTVLEAIIREIWTSDILPEEIAEVRYWPNEGPLGTATARPSRPQGRHGHSTVDPQDIGKPHTGALTGQHTTLHTAIDQAIERAIAASWLDSSYA